MMLILSFGMMSCGNKPAKNVETPTENIPGGGGSETDDVKERDEINVDKQ